MTIEIHRRELDATLAKARADGLVVTGMKATRTGYVLKYCRATPCQCDLCANAATKDSITAQDFSPKKLP